MTPSHLRGTGKVMPPHYLGEELKDAMISVNMTAALLNAGVIFVLGVVVVVTGSVVSVWTDKKVPRSRPSCRCRVS